MTLYLKFSTIFATLVVLSALGTLEMSEASPLSVRNMKDFLNSILRSANSQFHYYDDQANTDRYYYGYRQSASQQEQNEPPSPSVRKMTLSEQLDDVLNSLLQESDSINDTMTYNNSTEDDNRRDFTKEREQTRSNTKEDSSEKTGNSRSKKTRRNSRRRDRPCNHESSRNSMSRSETTEPLPLTTEEPLPLTTTEEPLSSTTTEVPLSMMSEQEMSEYRIIATPEGHPILFIQPQEGQEIKCITVISNAAVIVGPCDDERIKQCTSVSEFGVKICDSVNSNTVILDQRNP